MTIHENGSLVLILIDVFTVHGQVDRFTAASFTSWPAWVYKQFDHVSYSCSVWTETYHLVAELAVWQCMQARIKRGAQGALAPGPPSSKGPPATEKKTIITIFNNANVIKVRQIWLLSASWVLTMIDIFINNNNNNNNNNTQLVTRHMSMKTYYQIWRNWIAGALFTYCIFLFLTNRVSMHLRLIHAFHMITCSGGFMNRIYHWISPAVLKVVVRGPAPVRGAQVTGPRNNFWKEDQK